MSTRAPPATTEDGDVTVAMALSAIETEARQFKAFGNHPACA
jgi:hypothetical protein